MQRKENEWVAHEIREITFFILLGIIMTIIIPLALGWIFKGFEETLIAGRALRFGDFFVNYLIYYIFILGALIGLPILKIREMYVTKRGESVARQSEPSLSAVAYLHDPEVDGLLHNLFGYFGRKGNRNPMRWSQSILRVFVYSALFFGALGIYQTFSGINFTEVPNRLFQQITPLMQVYFTAEPPSFGETMIMIFIFSLLMGLVAYGISKFKLPTFLYWVIGLILVCPFIGVAWMGMHLIAYGGSDFNLFQTFIFGWIGSTLTLLFGTFIVWYVWHFMNNTFSQLYNLYPANEDILFISIAIWIVLLLLTIGTEILLARRRKKKRIINAEPKVF